jgi:MFS transporter, AAHS family, 4-hydroxybenzoate transporter
MAGDRTIDVIDLIDRQKVGSFGAKLLFWAFVALCSEGYDLFLMGFAAPDLVKVWHVERAALGPVFSASIFGVLCGAPFFGFLGDRIGRKPAIILSVLGYGTLSLATMAASSLDELIVLRFLTGIALSGVFPNTIALAAEYAPRRWRATTIFVAGSGLLAGGALPGPVSALLVAHYGWQVLFLVGGVLPILVAGCLLVTLPESLKFLALHKNRQAEAARLAARLSPGLAVDSQTRFTVPGEERAAGFSPRTLFAGPLQRITPPLWLMYAVSLMTVYFLYNWMPLLFESIGISSAHAALITSMYQVGGMLGGFVLCILIDRSGLKVVAIAFAIGCPMAALIGLADLTDLARGAIVALAGVSIGALQQGCVARCGVIYPTGVRSKGLAWASAVGRLGSMSGPIIGGLLVGMHLSVQQLFLAPMVPLAVGAAAAFVLARRAAGRSEGPTVADPSRDAAREKSGAS